MDSFTLGGLDISLIIIYIVVVIAYGLYHSKRKSSEDYFLAGRNITWPIVGISLFAANISSNTMIGLASDAYSTGISVYNYEWMAAVVLVFFAIFFLPFYLRSRVYTMPEFLERRYDKRSRYYFSFVAIVGNVIIDTATALYAGSLILKLIFPGIDMWVIVALLAFVAAVYTIPGGLSSVLHTEVLQAFLLIAGSIVLTTIAYNEAGGWGAIVDSLHLKNNAGELPHSPSDMLSLVRPISDKTMPWTGLLLGAPILGFYFWANNQFMVQRVLSAKSISHGRWGALFAGFLKLPVIFFMVLPGTMAIVLFGDMNISDLNYFTNDDNGNKILCESLSQCPNMTYPLLIFQLLPPGLLGLVIAGLLAAMSSSISAIMNSASTLITMDFVQKFSPNLTSKQLVKVGQFNTLILVVLSAAWAPQIEKFGSLFQYLQDTLAFICPPVVAVFLGGLFWKRANSNGAFGSLVFGGAVAIFIVLCNILDILPFITEIHFLHRTFIISVLCFLVLVIISLSTKEKEKKDIDKYLWTKKLYKQETEELLSIPWYLNFRYLAIGLLIITSIIVIMFW